MPVANRSIVLGSGTAAKPLVAAAVAEKVTLFLPALPPWLVRTKVPAVSSKPVWVSMPRPRMDRSPKLSSPEEMMEVSSSEKALPASVAVKTVVGLRKPAEKLKSLKRTQPMQSVKAASEPVLVPPMFPGPSKVISDAVYELLPLRETTPVMGVANAGTAKKPTVAARMSFSKHEELLEV